MNCSFAQREGKGLRFSAVPARRANLTAGLEVFGVVIGLLKPQGARATKNKKQDNGIE